MVNVLSGRGGLYIPATTRWLDFMETQAMFDREENPHLSGDLPGQIKLFLKSTLKKKVDGIGGGKNARTKSKLNTDADTLEGMMNINPKPYEP